MEKPKVESTEERVIRYHSEQDPENLLFKTAEEAKLKVDEINGKYGDISFVAQDRGEFAVKFRMLHMGEGFQEYKPGQEKSNGSGIAA